MQKLDLVRLDSVEKNRLESNILFSLKDYRSKVSVQEFNEFINRPEFKEFFTGLI